jgi:signal transduction histidine kinase
MTTTMTTTRTTTTMTTEPGGRRIERIGIRARVVVGYVGLLAAALLISLLVTRQVLHARLDNDIADALTQEVEELRLVAAGLDPRTGEPFGDDVEAIFDTFLSSSVPSDDEAYYTLLDGRPSLRSFEAPGELFDDDELVAAWAGAVEPTTATTSTAIGEVRWLAAPLLADGDVLGTFVVTFFPQEPRAAITQNLRIVAISGLIVLAVSAAVAWSLAGRVLRPVRELTATAHEITDADLSARIPVNGHDELAELGRTFNSMLDRLESGFEQQRRFLDDVAHELRTPITIVRGHLELLEDDPDERAETVAIVTDELDRMNRYVDDLLVLAKAERTDFLRPELVELRDFAESTLRTLAPLAEREWTLDHAPPAGAWIAEADPERLTQALLNLASNAVDHTEPGDTIALGVAVEPAPTGRTVRLWVRDTGSGIDPDIAPTLFGRHTRGAASRATRPEGMGIGLSIVDAIARSHGGTATAAAAPGGGTRVDIAFPLIDGQAPLAPPASVERPAPATATATADAPTRTPDEETAPR